MSSEHEVMSNETKMAIKFMNDSIDSLKLEIKSHVSVDLFNSEMRFLRSKLEDIHNQTKTTNGKVIKNTGFRQENKNFIETLRNDREDRVKRYSDIIWKLALVGLSVGFGADKIGLF
jgi:hypothetical protein